MSVLRVYPAGFRAYALDVQRISARGIGAVFVGGSLGSLLRAIIAWNFPVASIFPLATMTVNLVGSFAIGALAGYVFYRGESSATVRLWLFAGVGFLGGFTTYSALAFETLMLSSVTPAVATFYAIFTVIAGIALAVLGLVVASKLWGPEQADSSEDAS